MLRGRIWIRLGILTALLAAPVLAQDPSAPAEQEARKARLAERDALVEQARELVIAGKTEEALQTVKEVLAVERKVFGEVHDDVAETLAWIAVLERDRGDFAAARAAQEKRLAILTQRHGARDWRVTDARRDLEELRRWEGLTAEERARLGEAKRLGFAMYQLWEHGAYREALRKAERVVAIRREILGEGHRSYAMSLYWFANLYLLTGDHPGLLSGLALTGANTLPAPDGDDGILTALEVAGLDLSQVELVVLSACETGLGEVAAGEGGLGLQRAFQVSGARTTVTSLWKVSDVATQLLMQRFYENLWDKGMPKLEALRQAQLWLMREGGQRGISPPKDEAGGGDPKRLPPYYWAAFVLSGDWR